MISLESAPGKQHSNANASVDSADEFRNEFAKLELLITKKYLKGVDACALVSIWVFLNLRDSDYY